MAMFTKGEVMTHFSENFLLELYCTINDNKIKFYSFISCIPSAFKAWWHRQTLLWKFWLATISTSSNTKNLRIICKACTEQFYMLALLLYKWSSYTLCLRTEICEKKKDYLGKYLQGRWEKQEINKNTFKKWENNDKNGKI